MVEKVYFESEFALADNYPAGTALTLEIPAGSIVADNGAKNLEFTAGVTIM